MNGSKTWECLMNVPGLKSVPLDKCTVVSIKWKLKNKILHKIAQEKEWIYDIVEKIKKLKMLWCTKQN